MGAGRLHAGGLTGAVGEPSDSAPADEQGVVGVTSRPVTVESMVAELAALGLQRDSTVLLHSSLSSLGWVSGGGVAVVEALLSVLGPGGTLVVPTQTSDLSDPAEWQRPPVPQAWWDIIRETTPAYRPEISPSRGMGAIAELVRTWPGARRSDHPQVSFAAVGPAAAELLGSHPLDDGLGEGSPLARLYEADASVLLLGVGHDRNTSMHLAEYRAGVRPRVRLGAPVLVDGRRTWVTFDDIDLDSADFAVIGSALEETGVVRTGQVGSATARLMPQREVVDHAARWLSDHAGAR